MKVINTYIVFTVLEPILLYRCEGEVWYITLLDDIGCPIGLQEISEGEALFLINN
jgi:hypothetical protein